MDLVRHHACDPREVARLLAREPGHPPRREPLDDERARVRLRDLEDVEVRVELRADRAERGDRLVQHDEPRRQMEVHRVDQLECLADRLYRIDVGEANAVVAGVELAEIADELRLPALVVAHSEVAQTLGQRLDVLGSRVDEQRRQLRHVVFRELPRLPEVDEADPVRPEHEHVRRMRVAVEEPVAEDHRHPRLGHQVREPAPVFHRRHLEIEIGDLRALEELEGQHACTRVAREDAWNLDVPVAGEVPVEGLRVLRLDAVVELLAKRACELVDELLRVDEVERADAVLRDPRSLIEKTEVGLDLPRRSRPLHLDRDPAAVREHRRVHLADRRSGDRRLVELEEEPLDRLPELLLDHLPHLRERDRRHVVLELSQLDDDVRRHDVGPRRQKLAELHERRPELVEHLPQTLAPLGRRAVRRREATRARAGGR